MAWGTVEHQSAGGRMFTQAVVHPTAWHQYAAPAAGLALSSHYVACFIADSKAWWVQDDWREPPEGGCISPHVWFFCCLKMATMVSTAQYPEWLTAHPFRDFPIGHCPSAGQSCTATAYNFDNSNRKFSPTTATRRPLV